MKYASVIVLLLSVSVSAFAQQDLNYINQPQMASIGITDRLVKNELTFAQIDRKNPLVRLNAPTNVKALLKRVEEAGSHVDLKKIQGAYYCRQLTDSAAGQLLGDYMDCSIKEIGGVVTLTKDSGTEIFTASLRKVTGLNPAIVAVTSTNSDMGSNGILYADDKELYVVIKERSTNRIVELVQR